MVGDEGDRSVTPEDVVAAAHLLEGQVVRTPFLPSTTLSRLLGAELFVKFENLQFTASFKDRGARCRLERLSPEERRRGVVALSAGNHAQGVAYHAGRLGIPATVVMPTTTPNVKVRQTEQLGARVVQEGTDVAACEEATARLVAEEGLTLVHPYDDPDVIAGQGTVGLEILEEGIDLDALVVPVGGGGLVAGVATITKARRPELEVIGVQVQGWDGLAARGSGHPPGGGPTLADGIAVKHPGRITGAIVDRLVDDVVVVAEASIEHAVVLYLEIEKTVSEGAGAAALAAVVEHGERFAGRRVGLVLSGGNIDSRLLSSVILRGLVRQGRMAHLRIEADDLPGSLASVTAIIGRAGADVIEVSHQRLLPGLPVRRVDIDVLVETRGAGHTDRLLAALTEAGHRVTIRTE
jgi:threonine dehydratase